MSGSAVRQAVKCQYSEKTKVVEEASVIQYNAQFSFCQG